MTDCHQQPLDWLACGPAMDYLHCSGCPLMAVWTAVWSVLVVICYLLVAREFWAASHNVHRGESMQLLRRLVAVFVACAVCGYATKASAVFGVVPATAGYWVKAFTYPPLTVFAASLFWSLHRWGAVHIVEDLELGERVRRSGRSLKEINAIFDELLGEELRP